MAGRPAAVGEMIDTRCNEGTPVAKTSKRETPLRLLTSVPSKHYGRLVVRYPFQTDGDFAHAYEFAAKRVASTFSGQPVDDLLLLPFLTLYRQAFELQLKHTIRSLVRVRMNYVDGPSAELAEAVSDRRFKDNNELGHDLYRLFNEVRRHFDALKLPDAIPSSVEAIISSLHEADSGGTAFRYAGILPDTQEHADFPDLAKVLDDGFRTLTLVIDYCEGAYEASPTLSELESDFY